MPHYVKKSSFPLAINKMRFKEVYMKLLDRNFVCLSLALTVITACQSSNGYRSGQASRFYATNRTSTVSDEFRSDADLEKAVNQSFKKSQKSKNSLTESQTWDANKQVSVSKQKAKNEQQKTTTAISKNKQQYVENQQQSQQNNDKQPVVYSVSTKAASSSNQSSGYTETNSTPNQYQTQYIVQIKQTNTTTQTNAAAPVAGQYYIQAGCYSHEDVALSQVAKLKANGISNVSILNEGGMSKVRVGPYTNKESGASVLNKMKNQLGFVDSFWKY